MSNSSGLMGRIYVISEWIVRFSFTNLLWILFNLPIAFLFLNLLLVDQIEAVISLLLPLLFLMPILFFPATTAMFAVVRGWIMQTEDSKSYWHYYKENYKRSVVNGLILTSIWLIWAVDLYYFFDKNKIMGAVFIVLGILLFVFTINLFSVTVHYHMKWLPAFKNTFLLTIGSPMLFISVAISSGIILFVSFTVVKFLLPLLAGSLIAFLSFSAFHRSYLNLVKS
ncbi:YesL family protein [Sporosarcina sp. NPDC096371]|uniref:YesL family protein n=1 Tax=Sporosarcina sp. NPDC096371 TaxID=3364530 RepID=UPI0037F49D0C